MWRIVDYQEFEAEAAENCAKIVLHMLVFRKLSNWYIGVGYVPYGAVAKRSRTGVRRGFATVAGGA